MDTELHGLDWCAVHHRRIPGVKQRAGKPCPYCGNPLPLRSEPYRIAADGTPGATVTPRDLKRVQWHFELLHAEEPDLAQDELWRRAEQAAASSDGPSDAELSQLVLREEQRRRALATLRIFGVSLRAVVGFILMCIATGLATMSIWVIWDWNSPGDSVNPDIGVWLWLTAFLLGPVALAVVVSAKRQIERSQGVVRGEAIVVAGLMLAIVGTVEITLLFLAVLPGAMVGSL